MINTTDALEFLKSCQDGRIVSTGDLTTIQIAEFSAAGNMFVEPGGGLGWCFVPWDLTTIKDRRREADYFSRNNMMI